MDRRQILKATGRLVELIPNLIFLVVYTLAMLSPIVSPLRTQIPAFLNMGFMVIGILLLLALVFYLIRRNWLYVAVYCCAIILSWGYLSSYFPINYSKGLKEERDLRVMTYNVEGFSERDAKDNTLATSVIHQYDPDILALQESNFYPQAVPDKAVIKRLIGTGYPYVYVYRSQTIASKYPIIAKEEIEYEGYSNGSSAYLVEHPNGKKILVVNNHMESYALLKSEKEKYKVYVKEVQLSKLKEHIREVKNRLGPHLNQRAMAARKVELEVRKIEERLRPDVVIVLGDLNDTPMSYTYYKLRDSRHDAYAEVGNGLGASYNDRWLPFRIDHLFYSGSARAIGGAIPQHKNASDHNPLIVDFSWVNNNE